jgi:hypothetical protein
MADYFLCLDGETFTRQVRPALAASWARRSFEPCRALCAGLGPAALEYARRYHTGADEPLVSLVAAGLPFDRARWRTLVGEVLLFAALEIPEFQTNADALCRLLAAEEAPAGGVPREQFSPIRQALRGSRDLTFGAAVYRPEHAGYNDAGDVARLADYLAAVRPERWTPDDLRGLPDVEGEEERADELEFVREWSPVLVDLYMRTREQNHVLVIESIY